MLPSGETAASPAAPGPDGGPDGAPALSAALPAVVPVILTRRADFIAASRARRQSRPGLMLQARHRAEGESADPVRIGFTCSKKVGNAVARNRAKRRLREVARAVLPREGKPGWDYVLVAKPGATVDRPFEALLSDLHWALRKVHAP